MKLELHKAYKTRGGWRAVVVKFHPETQSYLVWHDTPGRDDTVGHSVNGYYEGTPVHPGTTPESYDLIEEWFDLVTHEGWLNFYKDGPGTDIQKTRECADRIANAGRVACIRIKFTEGEGL